jgi:6-phospho-3-hexuloisomerase
MTTEISNCLQSVSYDEVRQALGAIDKAQRLYIAGAGRSGLAMRAFAMRLMHLGKQVHVVGDVTTPGIRAGDLLVVGSGSGRTESLQVMAQKAKRQGAEFLLLTIDPTSPIASMADTIIRIPAPADKAKDTTGVVRSVQPMGSLFEQCLFLLGDAVILSLMEKHDISAERMFGRHANLE